MQTDRWCGKRRQCAGETSGNRARERRLTIIKRKREGEGKSVRGIMRKLIPGVKFKGINKQNCNGGAACQCERSWIPAVTSNHKESVSVYCSAGLSWTDALSLSFISDRWLWLQLGIKNQLHLFKNTGTEWFPWLSVWLIVSECLYSAAKVQGTLLKYSNCVSCSMTESTEKQWKKCLSMQSE